MFMEETNQLTTMKTIQSRVNNGWKEQIAQGTSSEETQGLGPGQSGIPNQAQMTDVIGGHEGKNQKTLANQNHREENLEERS